MPSTTTSALSLRRSPDPRGLPGLYLADTFRVAYDPQVTPTTLFTFRTSRFAGADYWLLILRNSGVRFGWHSPLTRALPLTRISRPQHTASQYSLVVTMPGCGTGYLPLASATSG